MSVQIGFKLQLAIGDEMIPLDSEVVAGDAAPDGVRDGFLFHLALEPNDAPVQIDLGALINYVQTELGVGDLQASSGFSDLQNAFPASITGNFTSTNDAMVVLRRFEINSTTDKKLFALSMDVESTDPTTGFIPLPAQLASWLAIDNLAIAVTVSAGGDPSGGG